MSGGSNARMLVIMLCGIPGAGKSTVAAGLLERLPDAEVVATDMIGGRGDRYRKLRRRLAQLAESPRFVILDATFFARRMRERLRRMGYPVILVHLACPTEVCLERNRRRKGAIAEKGLLAMAERFEEPTEDEEPLVVHTDRMTPRRAAELIDREVLRRLGTGGGPP